jgi:hypothetical protein
MGAATGLGLWGYSHIRKNSDSMETLTASFSKALSDARLKAKAEGVVQLQPAEISLAPNQTLALESNSRVALEQRSKVVADGELRIQIPSVSAPSVPVSSQQSAARAQTITNFTVFKSVAFDKGRVETGWNFLASTQRDPSAQYCYYTENLGTEGEDFSLDIGLNGSRLRPKTLPSKFDLDAAFANCVWFKAGSQ